MATIENRADPIDVLELRAWARVLLLAEGEIQSVAEAVDPLQAFAVTSGLVAQIGADGVQKILSGAFAPYPEAAP